MTVAHRIKIQIVMRLPEEPQPRIGPIVSHYFCNSTCFDKARTDVRYDYGGDYNVLMFQKPNAKIEDWVPTTCCAECDRAMPYGSRDAEELDVAY